MTLRQAQGRRLRRRRRRRAPTPPTTREFPAGSYIVRIDQPYSRIADTLLDYQYLVADRRAGAAVRRHRVDVPRERSRVQAVRVTDVKVLDAPMELVKGDVKAPSGVSGTGSTFAINHNADNALITLRYKLKDADIQVAEEPFESGGIKFNRGSFMIKGVSQADLDKVTGDLGLKAYGLAADPGVKVHPARAARIAILHSWTSTQTEGWWRQAFDTYQIPYDYIDPKAIRDTADLRAKYDVIIFGPGGSQSAVEGTPLWQTPIPYQNTVDTPNIGTWAQSDDIRIGMGLEGLLNLRKFIDAGGAFIASNSSADFAITNNFTYGVTSNRPATTTRVVGSLLRAKLADDDEPGRVRRAGQSRRLQRRGRDVRRQRDGGRRRPRRGGRRRRCGRRRARRRRGRPADRTRHAGRSRRRPGTRRRSKART